jgi:hypothetical protein
MRRKTRPLQGRESLIILRIQCSPDVALIFHHAIMKRELIMNDISEFSQMVSHAIPYALQCGNLNAFAKDCANEVERSGEPAFYLTTKKLATEPHRFPVALEMWGYNDETNESFLVAQMNIIRPEYRDNAFGFRGNHLVVALLEQVREKLQLMVPDGVEVLTSNTQWRSLIHGPGYSEKKTQRALSRVAMEPTEKAIIKNSRI